MSDAARARRILAWREEHAALEAEGIVTSGDATLVRVAQHHEALLAGLAASGDIDLTREDERLSAGMRLATLLGAAALSIAWAMFVDSLWSGLDRNAKLGLVWLPPFLLLLATGYAARREASGYVANIVGTVGGIAMAVAAFATHDLFGVESPRWPFLLFGGYGMFLAYRYRLVLPLLIGIVGVGAWAWSLESILIGARARDAFDHAEPLILIGLAGYMAGARRHQRLPAFAVVWRLAGVVAMIAPLLLLGVDAGGSWFGRGHTTELLYQLVALVAFVAMVWAGLRRDDAILARGGATALVLFLCFRLVDWFWEAIPDWLFFLLMGGLALGALLVLRAVRTRRQAGG